MKVPFISFVLLTTLVAAVPAVHSTHTGNPEQYGTTGYCEDELALWVTPNLHSQPYLIADPGTEFQVYAREHVDESHWNAYGVITFYDARGRAVADAWGNIGTEGTVPDSAAYGTFCLMYAWNDVMMEPTPVGIPIPNIDFRYVDGL